MVGLMTLTWAWAENTLAMTIGIISEHVGPIKGYPEPPLMLNKRIACLKVALRDIEVLKGLQQDGRALAVRFKELGARRHKFIHSAAWELADGRFQAMRIRVIAGQNEIEDHSFDQADAIRLTAEIAKLQDDAAAFMLAVASILESRPVTPGGH